MKKIFQPTDCLSPADLQDYINDNLTEDRRFRLENHLLDCPLCSEALEGYAAMDHITEMDFGDLYEKIDQKTKGRVIESRQRFFSWNNIAAGFIFLILASAAYLYYQGNRSATNAYQAYFENQDNSFAVRSIKENSFSKELLTGIELYNNENYQASLSFFEDYLKSKPETVEAAYYAGLSALHVGEQEMAIDWLMTVRLNSDQLYEEVTWRLAEIHLKRGDRKKAKVLLSELVKLNSGYYAEQAKNLLEVLQ